MAHFYVEGGSVILSVDSTSSSTMSGSCSQCHKSPSNLLRCSCEGASYCDSVCQKADWKRHKPLCPPYRIREIPGKGKGMEATRNIKAGAVILEETPLLSQSGFYRVLEILRLFQELPQEQKQKVLSLHDPGEGSLLHKKIIEDLQQSGVAVEDVTDEGFKFTRIVMCNDISVADIKRERKERLQNWNFECCCTICSLQEDELKKNEELRSKIMKQHENISKFGKKGDVANTLTAAKQKLELMSQIEDEVILEIPEALLDLYEATNLWARIANVDAICKQKLEEQANEYKNQALKMAKKFGDHIISQCEKRMDNFCQMYS